MAPGIVEGIEGPAREMLEELFKPRRARRGRVLFRPGDRAEHVYYLEDGWVRIYTPADGEGEITLAVVGPGEIFGEAALHGDREYGVYAEVMSPGALYLARSCSGSPPATPRWGRWWCGYSPSAFGGCRTG